jgi:hypothetical protein
MIRQKETSSNQIYLTKIKAFETFKFNNAQSILYFKHRSFSKPQSLLPYLLLMASSFVTDFGY